MPDRRDFLKSATATGRGTATYGTQGSLVLDRDGYVVYDLSGKVVKENIEPKKGNALDLIGDAEATKYWARQYAPGWAPSA